MLEKTREGILSLSVLRRCTAIIISVAIVLTVVFIFSNSMKPPAESTADSNAVKDVIATIIPPESDLGQKILSNIRKIAHFTEYGLLGIEVTALLFVLTEKRRTRYLTSAKTLLAALVVAFFDETIQMFTKRGPMIQDVWIDVGGFFTYALLTHAAIELVCLVKYVIKKIKR